MRRGFLPIVILIGIALLGVGSIVVVNRFKLGKNKPNVEVSKLSSPNPALLVTPSPEVALLSSANSPVVQSKPSSNTTKVSTTPVIESVSPTKMLYSKEIVIKGKGFGTEKVTSGGVNFFKTQDNKEAGGTVVSWTDSEIRAKVPDMEAKKYYKLQMTRSDGIKSNLVYDLYLEWGIPEVLDWHGGNEYTMVMKGKEFGPNMGQFIFEKDGKVVEKCEVSKWSDTEITCQLPKSVPSFVIAKLITADGREMETWRWYRSNL